MIYPTLYKKTSTGKTQTWAMEINGDSHRTISGQLDGAKVTSDWKVCTPKNIGKANQVDAEEQAVLEVEAKYTKKKEQGRYHESPDDIDEVKFISPMLAKDYKKYPITQHEYDTDEVFSQPKLDGMRCIVTKDGMTSRNGKPINSSPHIMEAYAPIFEKYPDLIFDGELYADKLSNDFDTLMSLVKRDKCSPEQLAASKAVTQHWVYDVVDEGMSFWDRLHLITDIIDNLNSEYIVLVETACIRSEDELNETYAEYLEAGMEGQIVRKGSSSYKVAGRSKDLLKRKEFLDDEFTITGFEEGQGNWAGYAKKAHFEIDGEPFSAGIKGNREYTRELLENESTYIGQVATVRYQNLTPKNTPRFGVMYYIHGTERTT